MVKRIAEGGNLHMLKAPVRGAPSRRGYKGGDDCFF